MAVTPVYAVVPAKDVTHRVIRNPNYGGPRLSYQGWCSQPLTPATRKVKFFAALEESVRREGYRNPIIVWSISGELYAQFGVSRLRVGQLLDVDIPCIINSVDGAFEHCDVVTEDNWESFFTDVPEHHVFRKDGSFDYHYSMERNRRETYDPAGLAWADPDAEFIEAEFPWIDNVQR